MSFPQTRLTLIQRLAAENKDEDWSSFVEDYWGPVCRFASSWGRLSAHDAEDVAAETFEVVLRNQLLSRWNANRAAKLRSLLCTVVRNLLSNRARKANDRRRRLQDYIESRADNGPLQVAEYGEPATEHEDEFYAVWVDDILQQAAEQLMRSLHEKNQGDRFRVLHGRVCEGLSMKQLCQILDLRLTTAENYLKATKKLLARFLEQLVREQVQRYADKNHQEEEFQAEWGTLGQYLKQHGGLETVLRRVHHK